MGTITIRNLPDEVIARLKDSASHNGRSMEAEARIILENASSAASPARDEAIRWADAFRKSLDGSWTGNATAWIREERDSR